MKNFISYLMRQARKYTVVDFAFFKLALLLFGIIIGTYFSGFFRHTIWIWWIAFVISWIIVMIATFRKNK